MPTRTRPSPAITALLAVLALLAALAVLGCESRSQEAPAPDDPSAHLLASAGFGAEVLLDTPVPPDQSVMRALRGATQVEVGEGGGFVVAMLGRESDRDGQRDWFFYVNGIAPPVGALEVEVEAGDVVLWDYHHWGDQPFVPVTVGAWPEPFASAAEPVRADPPLDAALRDAGVELTEGESPWRVRVASDARLREEDPAWRRANADPMAAGLIGTIEDGQVVLLGPGGVGREPVPGARALVAAVPTGESADQGVLLAVVGVDEAAAQAAAARIAESPEVLARVFALAFDGEGEPLRAAGRSG